MSESTTPQLTESDVLEIEQCNHYESEAVFDLIPALIRDWRALSEKYARLADTSGEWAKLLDRVRLWSKCADGYPLDEHINNITTQNTALREQLGHAKKQEQILQEQITRLAALAEMRSDVIAAKAAHVDDLESRLVQVTSER